MSNWDLSAQFIKWAIEKGCHHFVVCAGSRNQPLVEVLSQVKNLNPQIKMESFFEERSAAFYALGKIKKTKKPVAILTTSGTAVGNLLPAIMEAHYSALPLLALTADRPASYRGSGAPQSVEQVNIFSSYASTLDIESAQDLSLLPDQIFYQPQHFNICFDEPLYLGETHLPKIDFSYDYKKPEKGSLEKPDLSLLGDRPLVIVGALDPQASHRVLGLLKNWQGPIYFEAHSQKGSQEKWDQQVLGGDKAVRDLYKKGIFNAVIRIGGVPTLRFWRDLEKHKLPVIHFSDQLFSGLSYSNKVYPLKSLEAGLGLIPKNQWTNETHNTAEKLKDLILKFKNSEVGQIYRFLKSVPEGDNLFVGNSLPIRELDMIFSSNLKFPQLNIYSQRGANGIDGLVSTSIGLSEDQRGTWALLGDLTTLYDLSGPWACSEDKKINWVILNNSGGQIFSRVSSNPMMLNRHGLGFESWAKMWGLSYQLCSKDKEPSMDSSFNKVYEVVPDPDETESFWKSYEELF